MRCVEVWLVKLIVHLDVFELLGAVQGGPVRSLRFLLVWTLIFNMLHLNVEVLTRVQWLDHELRLA